MLIGRGASLHWHGLSPINPWMDGAFEESQCLIDRGSFTYHFAVQADPGTYWWHGHAVTERIDGLYGALIVDPPYTELPPTATESEKLIAKTDGEFVMLLQDWSHFNSIDQDVGLESVPPHFAPLLSSVLLVNGKVNPGPGFIASDPTCMNETTLNPAAPPPTFQVFSVEKGKSYYFRIINAGSFAFMAFQFQGHKFTVVSADGEYVKPFEATTLTVGLAQRYGVILTADQDAGQYWIPINQRYPIPSGSVPSGAAILHYVGTGAPQAWGASAGPPPPVELDPTFNPNDMYGARPLPADMRALNPDVEIIVDGYFNQELAWVLNGTIFEFPPSGTPLMNYAYSGKLDELDGTPSAPVAKLSLGQVVDIVYQNRPLAPTVTGAHAWHLHGFSFYVLGYGAGKFDRQKHANMLNFENPVFRDTVILYPNASYDGNDAPTDPTDKTFYGDQNTGWSVVRFKADYPGTWIMHCHIAPHQFRSMITYISVQPDQIPPPPPGMPECGLIEQFEMGSAEGPPAPTPSTCIKKWGRCGGKGYSGATCCEAGTHCQRVSDYFSHCV